jgi:rSAM/selenodomain-associated transferase 2
MPISVIIPTLNEAACLASTIDKIRAQQPHEILVVDGGSTDATAAAAAQANLFLCGPRGRARQMNLGAAHATGDGLLFLHADCTLEAGALAEAERCLRRPGVAAGCFTMRAGAEGLLYRWIDFFATARVRLTGLVYGDQGLFLRRNLFERLGGFPPLGLMEDIFFSRRLRRHGQLIVARPRIFVSPRRWQRVGVVRQTARNWTLLVLALMGVHPDRLAAAYPAARAEPGPATWEP